MSEELLYSPSHVLEKLVPGYLAFGSSAFTTLLPHGCKSCKDISLAFISFRIGKRARNYWRTIISALCFELILLVRRLFFSLIRILSGSSLAVVFFLIDSNLI